MKGRSPEKKVNAAEEKGACLKLYKSWSLAKRGTLTGWIEAVAQQLADWSEVYTRETALRGASALGPPRRRQSSLHSATRTTQELLSLWTENNTDRDGYSTSSPDKRPALRPQLWHQDYAHGLQTLPATGPSQHRLFQQTGELIGECIGLLHCTTNLF